MGETKEPRRIVWTGQAKSDIRAIEQPIALQILKTLAMQQREKAIPGSFEMSSHR